MLVGEKIKNARKAAGLTQDELAALVKISRRSIAEYETSTTISIRKKNLHRLAEALNISYEYLSNDEITDPRYGAETAPFIDQARKAFGDEGAKQLTALISSPGLSCPETWTKEDRTLFYQAVTDAFLFGKKESAKEKAQKNQR